MLQSRNLLFLIFLICNTITAQELYPLNEPASTIPNHVLGVRIGTHFHVADNKSGHRDMLRLMYGLGSKISIMLSPTFSNTHVNRFPENLNFYYKNYHNHGAKQFKYSYSAESIHFYSKWRFFSKDGENRHFRMAIFGEASYASVLHLDAFPNLLGDNSGLGLGLICTKLEKKLALSLTSGFSKFLPYNSPKGTDYIEFEPGNAFDVNFSIGYLLFPKSYKDYKDLNVNVYLEINNKFYNASRITRNNYFINADQFEYLKKGSFTNISPSVQFIFNSKTRLDLAFKCILYSQNDIGKNAFLMFNIQRYFY